MKHMKSSKVSDFNDSLTLAHGETSCRRAIGRKGVPTVYVPWDETLDNIDLFPEGFLWERGCTIIRGQEHTLRTPKDRIIQIKTWGGLPYIMKDELQRVIDDLPEAGSEGRSGATAATVSAARVSRNTQTHAQVRDQLKHLREDMSSKKLNNVCSKYRQLPESYYGGDSSKFVTPDNVDEVRLSAWRSQYGDEPSQVWEWYSGSAALSSHLKKEKVVHLPPLDYRYGWNLSKRLHQMKALNVLLTIGCYCLFASPNCAPWGNNSRSSPPGMREEKRAEETSTLTFLAVACFF